MVASVNSNWDFSIATAENRPELARLSSPGDIQSMLDELTYLPQRDRRVLELRARAGFTLKHIADLTGRSRSAVSRRLSAVSQRLRDPLVRALLRYATDFEPQELQIALLHFAGGQGVQRIARDRRISERRVVAALATARGWHRNLRDQGIPVRRGGDNTPANPSDRRGPTRPRR